MLLTENMDYSQTSRTSSYPPRSQNQLRSSVEADHVKEALPCFLLEEQLVQTVFQVFHMLQALAELTDEESSKGGALQRVFHVHVDHVHRLECILLSGTQICHHCHRPSPHR